MAEDSKSLGQIYYEEVEALKEGGMSNAEAIREVAKKHGKNENAVRGGIHQYRTKHLGGGAGTTTRRGRRSAPSVEDLMAQARKSLEDALALVDREVDDAKAALEAAQARYDQAVAEVKDKKAEIEKKLKALT
jgi:predicted  nucleic acid-binding Zn-ribbon protein